MDTRENKTDSAKVPNRSTASVSRSNNVLILATIADTTWRLFVPTLGLLGLGIWVADKTGHRRATFALVGVVIGAVIGYLLVFQQYRKANAKGAK